MIADMFPSKIVMEHAWKFLNSPAVETMATLFILFYPLTVLVTLRRSLTAHEFANFRRGAELGCLSCIFLQQFTVLVACLVEYETRWVAVGSILYSPTVVPCLSMVALLLVDVPLAARTHCSMSVNWIGALCACLIQQGLWMAYSLIMSLTTQENEHVKNSEGTIFHILAVMFLGMVPIAFFRCGCCCCDGNDPTDDEEVDEEEKDNEIMGYHELV